MDANAYYHTPTRRQRFWRWAGFCYHLGPDTAGPNLQGWLQTYSHFKFDFSDRLRLLLTGRLVVKTTIYMDSPTPMATNTRMDWEIKAPGEKL